MKKAGFVLTLDLILGLALLFTVVFISLFFISRGSDVTLSEHQPLLIGSDIITIMDEENVFDTLDHSTIEDRMQELLPGNYEMLISVQGNFTPGNGTIEVGNEVPDNRLIISGRRVALTDNDIYLKITYTVWVRKE